MESHARRRFNIVHCSVVGHAQYGLLIESEDGERGFVDSSYVTDTPGEPRASARVTLSTLRMRGRRAKMACPAPQGYNSPSIKVGGDSGATAGPNRHSKQAENSVA